jgi:polyketide synthase PksJ
MMNIRTLQELILATRSNTTHGISVLSKEERPCYQSYHQYLQEGLELAHHLRSQKATPGDIIIIHLEDIKKTIISLWACLLGNFVPGILSPDVDPFNDSSNLSKLIAIEEHCCHILTNETLSKLIAKQHPTCKSKLICFDYCNTSSKTSQEYMLENTNKPNQDDLALLVFSSGSTGEPKLIAHTHRSILSSIQASKKTLNITSSDTTLNWLPLDHAGPLIRCLLRDTLAQAKQIHAYPETILSNPINWLRLVDKYTVTNTWAPNYAFQLAVEAAKNSENKLNLKLDSLKFILNTGEPIIANTIITFYKIFKQYGLKKNSIITAWGMAETGSGITFHKISDPEELSDPISLGRPVKGVKLRIRSLDETPTLETGELEIYAPTLMKLYLNSSLATEKAFSDDRWLRTGDIAFIKNENLHLIGRKKNIIIVNGVKYGCKLIENSIEQNAPVHPSYTGIISFFKPEISSNIIVIFFTPRQQEDAHIDESIRLIRTICIEKFALKPDHVIPLKKKQIPKTSVGKIKRNLLLENYLNGQFDDLIREKPIDSALTSSESSLEDKLKKIYYEITGILINDMNSSFFEYGANSLLIIRLCANITSRFKVQINPADILEHDTIRDLGAFMGRKKMGGTIVQIPLTPLSERENNYPVLAMQRQFIFLHACEPTNDRYNIIKLFHINKPLDKKRLQQAEAHLLHKHEALRTHFSLYQRSFLQSIMRTIQPTVKQLKANSSTTESEKKVLIDFLRQPFDLFKAPLYRLGFTHLAEKGSILGLAIHHSIADPKSIDIIFHELLMAYKNLSNSKNSEKTYQFRHFVNYELLLLKKSTRQKAIDFWQTQLHEHSFPDIFLSGRKKDVPLININTIKLIIDDVKLISKLKIFCRRHKATMFAACLAAFSFTLMKKAAINDLCIGTTVSLRNREEFMQIIGCLFNSIVIRFSQTQSDTPLDFLKQTQTKMLACLPHKHYPFNDMIKALNIKPEQYRNPLFDIMFTYDYQEERFPNAYGISNISLIDEEVSSPKFDLSLLIREHSDHLALHWQYKSQLVTPDFISRLQKGFLSALQELSS